MAKTEGSVKLVNASIDEAPKGQIVFRGVLDPSSLDNIRVDTYQREVLPLSQVKGLAKAITDNEYVGDVTIGMRGASFTEKGNSVLLHDEVYIIDGLQRISVAQELILRGEQEHPHLGCIVHFNTTREFENDLFRTLNTKPIKLSSNVLIRNMRQSNAAVAMLYDLCYDRSFPLVERVCWDQQMKRGHLLTALGLVKITGQIHATYGPGLSTHWEGACDGINRTMRDAVTRKIMRENVKTFFELLDDVWRVRDLPIRSGAAHLKNTFLIAMGRVISNHRNFWDDNRRLIVPLDIRRKLKTFPINNPDIQRLASSGSTAANFIYFELVQHVNRGKRTHQLVAFKETDDIMAGMARRHASDREKRLADIRERGVDVVEEEQEASKTGD
jgi:hypothetical protein